MKSQREFYGWYRVPINIVAGLVLAFLVLPTLVIAPLSFNEGKYFTYPIESFSLKWYSEVLFSERWTHAFRNSFIVAIVSTLIATVIGTMASLGILGLPIRLRNSLLLILLSPMVIPIIVFAVGFFYFTVLLGMVYTLTALVWAHVVLAVPFVVIVVSASLERFDTSLIRAAYSLGASPITAFRRITLPLIAPGVMTGAIFAFVTSWDEIVVALFVAGGPENHTLPRRLWSGLREELSPAIIAAATVLSVLSIILMIIVERLRRSISTGESQK